MTATKDILAFLSELGVVYSASFVPFSQSRNKKKVKLVERSLNWRVNISRGPNRLTTDYSQGIAYCPSYKQEDIYAYKRGSTSALMDEAIEFECEQGRHAGKKAAISIPPIDDVLYSLVMDYSVLDHPNFESWASDYGYDFDSRTAEKTYKACMDIALQMRVIFGDVNMEKLRELFSDY